jgi:hypothetical protein
MTQREKVALCFIVIAIACFVVARLLRIENSPLNVVLILAGIGLMVLGLLRLRKEPKTQDPVARPLMHGRELKSRQCPRRDKQELLIYHSTIPQILNHFP